MVRRIVTMAVAVVLPLNAAGEAFAGNVTNCP